MFKRFFHRIINFLTTKEGLLLMTVADDIAKIKSDVAAILASPAGGAVDLSTVAKADALAAVATDVTAIKAELTVTPTV